MPPVPMSVRKRDKDLKLCTQDLVDDCTSVYGRFPPEAVLGPAFMPGGKEQDDLTY